MISIISFAFLCVWIATMHVDNRSHRNIVFLEGIILAVALHYSATVGFCWQAVVCLSAIEVVLGHLTRDYYRTGQKACFFMTLLMSFTIVVVMGLGKWFTHPWWMWLIPIVAWLVGLIHWNWLRVVAWVMTVAMLLMLVFPSASSFLSKIGTGIGEQLIGGNSGSDSSGNDQSKDGQTKDDQSSTTVETWYHFYNDDVQGDKDGVKGNNNAFGPNPIHDGWTAADYYGDQKEKLSNDPVMLAITTGYYDSDLGTNTMLGEFYESAKYRWAVAINDAGHAMAADENLAIKTRNRFFKDYEVDKNLFEVELHNAESLRKTYGVLVEDQFYQVPGANYDDGIPMAIVCETELENNKDDLFLVWKIRIKPGEKLHILIFRINCGYQPCNVSKKMDIQPTDINNPVVEGGDTPPKTDPPEKDKNPALAPKQNTEPNDTSGSGKNTNNGSGSTLSSEDKGSNSNHQTLEQYGEAVEELKGANGGGGDKPSTPPPTSDTTVDDNGGGAGEPTPIAPKDEDISSTPGDPWPGPSN